MPNKIQLKPKTLKAWAKPDQFAILKSCEHIKRWLSDPKALSPERMEQRMAVFSILSQLDQGREFINGVFAKSEFYSQVKVNEEMDRASEIGPYITEAFKEIMGGECAACDSGVYTSPINIKQENHIETEEHGFWEIKLDKNGEPVHVRPCYDDLFKKWQQVNEHVTLADTSIVYIYNGTHWVLKEIAEIKSFMQKLMSPKPRENHRREFIGQLKSENVKGSDWFQDSTEGYINLANGVYNIDKDTIEPHSSKFGFRYVLPYEYNPEATAPRFKQFLKEITQNQDDVIEVIKEFMGYALANGPCLTEKAMILYGSGANGKSTFMDTLKALAGRDNYASLSLTALNKDTKRYMVDGKLFNIGEETNVRALGDSEVFKTMVTGGEIDVKKLFVQDYIIKNRCKLIMACNDLPKSSDRSDGLYRRMLLIPFNAKFNDRNKDPEIREKLNAELPGIFNIAVEGYRRLKQNNWKFSSSPSIQEAMDEYKLENDNVLMWFRENVEWTGDDNNYQVKDNMYQSYKNMVEEDGGFLVNKIKFFKTIKTLIPIYSVMKKQVGTERKRVIIGIVKRSEL